MVDPVSVVGSVRIWICANDSTTFLELQIEECRTSTVESPNLQELEYGKRWL
jgi:hypothetical protein